MVSAVNAYNYANIRNLNQANETKQKANYPAFKGGYAYTNSYEKPETHTGVVLTIIFGISTVGSAVLAAIRGKKVAEGEKFIKQIGEGYKDIWKKVSTWVKNLFKKSDAK